MLVLETVPLATGTILFWVHVQNTVVEATNLGLVVLDILEIATYFS